MVSKKTFKFEEKRELFTNMLQLWRYQLSSKDKKIYRKEVLEEIEYDILRKVVVQFKHLYQNDEITYFPKPIDFIKQANKLKDGKRLPHNTQNCSLCNGVGSILTLFKTEKFGDDIKYYRAYGLACNCDYAWTGVMGYFDIFSGGFQFAWDEEKYDLYVDAFDEGYYDFMDLNYKEKTVAEHSGLKIPTSEISIRNTGLR